MKISLTYKGRSDIVQSKKYNFKIKDSLIH